MSKPMTIKSPSKAWAAVNAAGEIWGIDMMGRSKKKYTEVYFCNRYESDYKPHGWRIVRVMVTPTEAAIDAAGEDK